jgi:hypothetical protein
MSFIGRPLIGGAIPALPQAAEVWNRFSKFDSPLQVSCYDTTLANPGRPIREEKVEASAAMRILIFYCAFHRRLAAAHAGYRGIWYYNQPAKDQYVYKYSGGFAIYPQQQSPIEC